MLGKPRCFEIDMLPSQAGVVWAFQVKNHGTKSCVPSRPPYLLKHELCEKKYVQYNFIIFDLEQYG